jgi:DNA-binding transcriptional regulator LsrR (DeoR family)
MLPECLSFVKTFPLLQERPFYIRMSIQFCRSMPQRRVTEIDEVLAAYLFAEEGRTQAEIAIELGVSPAVVSRVLDRAEGRYIERRVSFLRDKVPGHLQSELEMRLVAHAISSELDRLAQFAYGRPGPKVRVLQLPEECPGEEGLASFARLAAPYVLHLVVRASLCGVTWGRMLANLVRAAKQLGTRPKTSTEFVPLAGEPLGFAPTSSSSSILADELQQFLRGHGHHARSLTMLPALIPRDFSPDERTTINKLIARLKDYRDIFVGGVADEPPIVTSLDALITSVGRDPLGFKDGSLLDSERERPMFIGDIGGVLLPGRPGTPEQALHLEAAMADLADRWTGLRLNHIRACAERAAADPARTVGVVVLSVGATRAPVIYECVKLGLISHLIIDGALEQALLEECRLRSAL